MFIKLSFKDTITGHPTCGFDWVSCLTSHPAVVNKAGDASVMVDEEDGSTTYDYYYNCDHVSELAIKHCIKHFLDKNFHPTELIHFENDDQPHQMPYIYVQIKFNAMMHNVRSGSVISEWHPLILRLKSIASEVFAKSLAKGGSLLTDVESALFHNHHPKKQTHLTDVVDELYMQGNLLRRSK